jgi:uncharacterized membrane protein
MKQLLAKLQKALRKIDPRIRRIVVGVIGGVVLLAGLAMIFLPGPAVVVIPAGAAILSTEFPAVRECVHKAIEWARRTGRQLRERTRKLVRKLSLFL